MFHGTGLGDHDANPGSVMTSLVLCELANHQLTAGESLNPTRLFFLIKFIRVTLVNMIMEVSGVGFCMWHRVPRPHPPSHTAHPVES